jgi:16S rRNA (adenine1518-N6/adenine1519-N6)-dimethyltransferase
MTEVRAKKHLGQHFLTDLNIAKRIADSMDTGNVKNVLEIGPGMGVLTQFLVQQPNLNLKVIELDTESVDYLQKHYPMLEGRIISADFLRFNVTGLFEGPFTLIGNFPYNISSQILFKMLENRNQIPQLVGMFQKEVAERVAAPPGNKTYGILSVLLQAFYHIEYLFTVHEHVFSPPPKVKSGVIRLIRNTTTNLGCNEALFFRVVKTGFNQRRKTLSNSLKPILGAVKHTDAIFSKRPEQLSVGEFVKLTNLVEPLLVK